MLAGIPFAPMPPGEAGRGPFAPQPVSTPPVAGAGATTPSFLETGERLSLSASAAPSSSAWEERRRQMMQDQAMRFQQTGSGQGVEQGRFFGAIGRGLKKVGGFLFGKKKKKKKRRRQRKGPAKKRKTHMPMSHRQRELAIRYHRPRQMRFANLYDGPALSMKRAKDRYRNQQSFSLVYNTVEDVCTKSLSKPWYKYCGKVLRHFAKVSEGLKYNDRPDVICMHIGACGKRSYVRQVPEPDPIVFEDDDRWTGASSGKGGRAKAR